MKVLLIGGTGTISMEISRRLLQEGHELYLLNRGSKNKELPPGVRWIEADIRKEAETAKKLEGMEFDCVADFIAFDREHLEEDYRLFRGKTRQFIFISSASAYQKPLSHYVITESTPLANPYWEYSRKKIEGEEYLMKLYRNEGFPVTIVRPSHTYSLSSFPVGVHGQKGSFQVAKRMLEGKPVLIPGDGSSLWTLTDSRDFAVGFVGLLGNIHAIGEAVQITSDESLTWNQIYQIMADALGVPLKPCHVSTDFLGRCAYFDLGSGLIGDKSNSVVFDNSKLKRLVPGFTAVHRYDQSAREIAAYVLSHMDQMQPDPEFDQWCDWVIEAQEEAIGRVAALAEKICG